MNWLLEVVVALAIVGLLLWVIQQIPMDPTIARIIRVVVIVAVCIWLLMVLVSVFGSGMNLLPGPAPLRRQ
jgi:hypothetical protein